jgi:predicted nucleic acid-binding protein
MSDTMALILRLEGRKMPDKVKEIFNNAEKGQVEIMIPSIVFAELAYLSERERIDTSLHEALRYLDKYPAIIESPMTKSTVQRAFEIDDIPELHDRLIAAAGKELSIPVLTNDPEMRDSKHVGVIW